MKRIRDWGVMLLLAALLVAPYFNYERHGEYVDAATGTVTRVGASWDGMSVLTLLWPLILLGSFHVIRQFEHYVESLTRTRVPFRCFWLLLLGLGVMLLSFRPWATEVHGIQMVNQVPIPVAEQYAFGIQNVALYGSTILGFMLVMHLLDIIRALLAYQAQKQKSEP